MKLIVALGTLTALAGAARADDVKPRSTVEVLDDKAQVDDVISRLQARKTEAVKPPELKTERPPLPELSVDKKTPVAEKRSPWRRPHHEAGSGSNERTERPRGKHK